MSGTIYLLAAQRLPAVLSAAAKADLPTLVDARSKDTRARGVRTKMLRKLCEKQGKRMIPRPDAAPEEIHKALMRAGEDRAGVWVSGREDTDVLSQGLSALGWLVFDPSGQHAPPPDEAEPGEDSGCNVQHVTPQVLADNIVCMAGDIARLCDPKPIRLVWDKQKDEVRFNGDEAQAALVQLYIHASNLLHDAQEADTEQDDVAQTGGGRR